MEKFKIIGKIDLSSFDQPIKQVSQSFTTAEYQEMYEENYRLEQEMDQEMYLDYEINQDAYEESYFHGDEWMLQDGEI